MAKNKGGRMPGGQRNEPPRRDDSGKGTMSVAEAGHRGGQREKELVEEGHRTEGKKTRR